LVCLPTSCQLGSEVNDGHTGNITLGVSWIIDEYDKLVLLSSLNVVGDIEPESEIPSSVESRLFTLLIRSMQVNKGKHTYIDENGSLVIDSLKV